MAKYKDLTNLIYQHLAWGPLYKKKDGSFIKDADNKSDIYIKEVTRNNENKTFSTKKYESF